MLILIFCADLHHDTTYHDVLRSMCGKRAQQMAAASIMCTCFGINVTFLVIIGDQFDRLFSTFVGPDFCLTLWFNRNFVIMLIACILIWPICYFKRLDFLRYVSTVGIFAMIYVVFLNVYEYYALKVTPGIIKTEPSNAIEVAASLPVIFFAYQSHEIVLPIYSSMEKPRSKNFIKSSMASLTLLFAIYTLGGTYGYLTFGSRVIADIIQMYDARDPVVVAGIIALIIKMITTYPPLMFCGRGAFEGLYAEWRNLTAEAYIRGEKWRRIIITTLWNIAVLMLAVVTPNITIAIEMLGSLAACNVFVFPGMCMVSLAYRHLNGYYNNLKNDRRILRSLEGTGHWTFIWLTLLVYGLFIILFGCAMFATVFIQVGNDILNHKQEDPAHEAPMCGLHSTL
ncbi:hypothetical protein RDWZM_007033 [Blomia tropicalis]|uniref:Amino acid transporter transmembrane domain-containing protein n=1 Tax=Blomia tropicalis TaxID=40697 RepID=A0A9Q0M8D7_BLOTA|nr:hypothetical protein RDWZM_007033 [Blomia tropicalis]